MLPLPRLVLGLGLLFLSAATKYELEDYAPAAKPDAVQIVGNARFTVLTERLIRMEYSASGAFEDRPTLAFVNRGGVAVPKYTTAGTQPFTLATEALNLTYTGGEFSSHSLKVVSRDEHSAFKTWTFGETSATDPGNLRGTFRTLDGVKNVSLDCSSSHVKEHCEWGLISRSGWALVNETGVPCLDDEDWWTDAEGNMLRNVDDHDLYLLAHGHDYEAALADFVSVAGRVPLLPRRNLGVWFTRWYDLNNADLRKLVDDYESRSLPLDVFILDMNWHKKDDWHVSKRHWAPISSIGDENSQANKELMFTLLCHTRL